MTSQKYKDIDQESLKAVIQAASLVLLATATDLETKTLHTHMSPVEGQARLLRAFIGDLTYYYGKFGLYNVVHVQSSMGSMSRSSSTLTVSDALRTIKSKVVIMIGIAFGVDEKKQRIGDVLISESIIPYDSERVGDKIISRGIEAPASKVLINRFKTLSLTWEHFLKQEIKAKIILTRLLSGEKLIDNLTYRRQIVAQHPDSKGGEMEGVGVYASCDRHADWILVKGICDFADGNKGVQKNKRQEIAMISAVSACLEIFNLPFAFEEFGIMPVPVRSENAPKPGLEVEKVLFDIYDQSKEPYYIERTVDSQFVRILNQSGIWIYGPSGSGKSNLIIRNLFREDKQFIQINLAGCTSENMLDFFREIYYSILEYLDLTASGFPKKFSDALKALLNLIHKHFVNRKLIIFIEEIPISRDVSYKEFSTKIFSFILSKNLRPGLEKVMIVLSSINSPTNHIQAHQQKIHNQLKFFGLKYWSKEEIILLIDKIEVTTKFSLPGDVRDQLLNQSYGSPRFIKNFFRSVFALELTKSDDLLFLIEETSRDLNLYCND